MIIDDVNFASYVDDNIPYTMAVDIPSLTL